MLRVLHKIAKPVALQAQLHLDHLPPERLLDLQWRKLQAVLKAAYDRTSFYRRRFKEIGAVPEDIKSAEDLANFPILTRDDLLNHAEEMLACPRKELRQDRSGGSTGQPLLFYFHHNYKYHCLALRKRLDVWIDAAGLSPRMYLWGATMRNDAPAVIRSWHRLTRSSFRYGFACLTPDRLDALLRDFSRIRPAAIYGYASLLLALAGHIREKGVRIARPPRAVVATAETLYPENRMLMEEAFGAPVYNLYGSHENSYVAGECLARRGLHVPVDHVYLEILAGDRPADPGEPGYLVVTDLDNLAMPFIRYRNEDIGAWSAGTCTCGRTLPMLECIYGREKDFIFDRDGQAYPGINLMRPLRPAAAGGRIRRFQYRQTERGRLQLLAVPGAAPDPGLAEAVRLGLDGLFHGKMEIDLTWVEAIPAEPSGKTPFVKSAIPYSAIWEGSER